MSDAQTHFAAGVQAFRKGNFKSAVEELERATQADPENSRAFSFLGAAYAEQGRYNAAIGAFRRAAEIRPNDPTMHYNLGQAYEVAGVPLQAWFEYKKALEINPRYGLARGALGCLNAKLRKGTSKGMGAVS